ncbi:MAG: hypothetical protein Q8Q05_01685 [bacterium]|nr:hypothetical protein [bacterium]
MSMIRYILPLGLEESLKRSVREDYEKECSYGLEMEGLVPPAIGSTVSFLPIGLQKESNIWTNRHEVLKVDYRVSQDMWVVQLARYLSGKPKDLSGLKISLELAGWKVV